MNILRMLAVVTGALLMPSVASAQSNPCGLTLGGPAIFCDTFDTPNPGIPSRTGGLHPDVWGVSRAIGDNVNFGQQLYNAWPATALIGCNGTSTVLPPNDVAVCNGQLREATNDNSSGAFDAGTVIVLAMYPKQPFDFTGRTGTVSFDLSNDTHGSHSAWPEFWFTDTPVPAPFTFQTWSSVPQHGFGIRFHLTAAAGVQGTFPNANNIDKRRWSVGSIDVIRNYVRDDTEGYGTRTALSLTVLDEVASPPDGSGITNHVELRISQNQIDVYATDAGVGPSAATLKHIAVITNVNLSATRGLIWLEDAHYNADKGDPPSQRQHTFVWDNVAFDGPFTYRDFSYDALDANTPVNNFAPNLANNLGKLSLPGQASSWNVLNIPANPKPVAVRVLFNFCSCSQTAPTTLNVTVNGHAHPTPWPYPDTLGGTWRTLAVLIPVTDLIAGTNVVQIGASDQAIVTSNVNIVLVNVPGGVPVLPGSNNAYPSGPVADTMPPSVPANLQASATSSTAVNLTWTASTDNVGVTGYKVFRSGVQINTVAGSPYNDTGLTAATQYSYMVAAYDAAGNTSAQSAAANATTQPAPPKTCIITIAPITVPQQPNFSGSAPYSGSCQQ